LFKVPWSPRRLHIAPEWFQDASKWGRWLQDCSQIGQDGPKMAPRWPKMASTWPQDCPKMAPRWPQDGFKIAPIAPTWLENGSSRFRHSFNMARRVSKMAPPKWPKVTPIWPQDLEEQGGEVPGRARRAFPIFGDAGLLLHIRRKDDNVDLS
jgi:hypothetical protein